jgi:hypothetical protein
MTSLTIRQSQMAVLTQAFQVSWLRSQLEKLYPAECEEMGPRGVSRLISGGLARATALGFGPKEYLSYLALEICFGQKFAKEDWAVKAMDGPETGKMDRLRRAGIFRLARLAEREQRHLDAQREAHEEEAADGLLG